MTMIAAAVQKKKTSSPSSTTACANLRAEYHNCFNKWYSEKYVNGQGKEEECIVEWKKYRACLAEHLEDGHLKRFLQAEGPSNTDTNTIKADPASELG